MKKLSIVILSVVLLFCSCHSTRLVSMADQYNSDYVGLNKSEIVNTFGEPTRVVPVEGVGEVLKYATRNLNHPTDNAYIDFYMTQAGICYQVRTNITSEETYYDKEKTGYVAGMSAGMGALGIGYLTIILMDQFGVISK